ncbi:MAG: replicative DNA helicase [Algoriphagus sp.]|jgi:replicative DNA helicase|uniref:replicative DNA helicase n=1 Tax=Algoriphagus sp. TaxID=1872435 RepID=UPI00277179D6|nr:replicative DNA helicase [Algoriphagus sp.]MDP4747424.1 replicative DNA helicase [Algoriphagus sp.]MDP4837939.1 replicative DNA helicase [Algoriphagus sp.]MDP4905401.1 replicative DNA helicase [Algoriphagus sp.]MDP4957560.1 replicative DNA helicase [Algoriphagus sp.]
MTDPTSPTGRYRKKPNFDNPTNFLGKVPPQAIELEEAVLGALMLEKDALTSVIDILKVESFYKESHKVIFQAILDLFTESMPIDLLTVTTQLRKNGALEVAGGAFYITELTSKVASAANIEFHARIITEQSIKRELIRISSTIQKDAFEETTDVFELLDAMEQSLFEISEKNIRKNYSSMSSIMREAITELEARKNQKDGLTGVPSGFTALDRVTSGWQKSDLVIIAARPAMGKTAFVLSVLRNAAVDHNRPVAIFSLEMSSVQLVNRLISSEAELDSEKIKKGSLADHEWAQLVHKTAKLSKAPLFVDDTPALSILELRAKCRKLKAQHDIQMVVVDYLQLMSGDSKGGFGGNREQEIASISRALKKIAKELSIPVIALSQLSRAVETRGGDKRPQLSDLRESGAIEQDADMVMFLYRPEYYGITEDEGGASTAGVGEVIIAKHRNGSLENIKLRFIGRYTKFTDLDGGMGFPSSQSSEIGYSRKFTSGASGVSGFDTDQTLMRTSKANEGDIESAFSGGDEPAPF